MPNLRLNHHVSAWSSEVWTDDIVSSRPNHCLLQFVQVICTCIVCMYPMYVCLCNDESLVGLDKNNIKITGSQVPLESIKSSFQCRQPNATLRGRLFHMLTVWKPN